MFSAAMYNLRRILLDSLLGFKCVSSLSSHQLSNVAQIYFCDSRICCLRPVHTVRGWKALANPKLAENYKEAPSEFSCEDGTDAVSHQTLISHLNNCNSVEEQIYALNSHLSLNSDDVANRKAFCNHIAETIKPYFAVSRVNLFGSSLNGLGFKGCDVDASVQTVLNIEEMDSKYAKYGDVPSLSDVLEGKVSAEIVSTLHPKFKLRLIRRILRQHSKDIREPILLIKARCPLLRFYHEKYNVFCDLTCTNRFALQNTKLLRLLCSYDERFGPLAKSLRYWGKHGKFVGDIERFNSHSFSLLIIHFLQNVSPPVIPPLNEIISESGYLTKANVDDDDMLLSDVKKLPKSKNNAGIDDLLKEFFYFYLYFDFDRVIAPITASSIPKQLFQPGEDPSTEFFEMSTITVQDPFRLSFNSTFGAEFRSCKKFLMSIRHACELYQKTNVWLPKESDWGLSAVLESTDFETQKESEASDQKSLVFDFPLEQVDESGDHEKSSNVQSASFKKAAAAVRNILEYGLLFKCKEMKFSGDHNQNQGELLRLMCEVTSNTWVGRYHIMKEHFSNVPYENLLELEHLISVKLVQRKDEQISSRQSLKLLCETYAIQMDNQQYLRIVFRTQNVRLPPIISIFLKDFVSKLLKSLL